MDLLLISDENKSHYVYINRLTNLCAIKQKIKIENISANVAYSVLVVKKHGIEHGENYLIINGKYCVKLKSGPISFKNYFKELPKIHVHF